jgi:hypothetical protein
MSLRRSRALSCDGGVLVTSAVLLVLAASAAGATPAHPGALPPANRYCATIRYSELPTDLYAKGLSCGLAVRVLRAWLVGPRSGVIEVDGGSGGFRGYDRLRSYPGFQCGSGAGGGWCTKHEQTASYVD